MLEVGPVILAGSLNFGKFTGHRAPGKAMLAYLGAFLAFLALGVQAEVEFKHHNNTEMAAVLQQVHNRWVKSLLYQGPKGQEGPQARLCWLTWGPSWSSWGPS